MVLQLESLVTDTTFGVTYAVKQYTQPCFEASAELRVAKALAEDAPHPHLVHTIDCFYQHDMVHLVLEYCSGGDLYDYLLHRPALPTSDARRVFEQVVAGLHHLHQRGFAHRDISLENILLDEHGDCKLCDFGLAAPAHEVSDAVVGKPFYMAPEVYAGRPYDPAAADMWGLGILLFMLVTGVPMISAPSDADGGYRIVARQGVKALLKLWNMETLFSTDLINVLDGLLTVNPKRRLSMRQLRAKLRPKGSWRCKLAMWF
ncbi:CAMK/CAMKL/NUAK protein kinase [Saprolegnia parasitica CBS 223.65]|uniref:CAMK/CAMKL/NUAK protein kinase n=1 Tax=Saprolegnia parasitica (strain CBS 223.65) TaxID=695850 RepID=A0A067CTD3_SAPPC|nr:CAMK/CAMKL/NUAK protein kinase [Saprolegnia parasitica CBS 223.65]KDO29786.1 CAMK/CAMKL/NUAK protein kinase [Saprolegnia parasitica CBS 223.65]|eukprot:XP_012199431.1 CAMK/CAMKL/NUAK protein kinase [Saprolegnia parasitica CBS 223.65]